MRAAARRACRRRRLRVRPPACTRTHTFLMATPEVPERDLSARMAALIMS